MEKNIVKKELVVTVVFLFIAVSFQPVFADYIKPTDKTLIESKSDSDEKVEYVIQIVKTNKVIENKIYLTQQQANELENLIENIRFDLNNSESIEETSEIYNDTIVSINGLGLLPEDMTVEEAQRLVTGCEQNPKIVKLLEKLYNKHKRSLDANENKLCLISGKTDGTYFLGPGYFLIDSLWWLAPSDLRDFILFFLAIPWIIFNYINPFAIVNLVGFGGISEYYTPDGSGPYYKPFSASGWISTFGKNGKIEWTGNFYGHLPISSLPALFAEYHAGVFGFTGLKISSEPSGYFFLGSSLWVKIDYNPPSNF